MLEKIFALILLGLVFLVAWRSNGWNTLDEEWVEEESEEGKCTLKCWEIESKALRHWSDAVREEVFPNGN